MQPTEVRDRVLRDHAKLRGQIDELERLTRRAIEAERPDAKALRARAEELLSKLTEHMGWEDRHLSPALQDADAWGPERAALLAEDHREQRAFLADLVEKLHDEAQPVSALASSVLDWIDRLQRDMEEEEAFFLDPNVLRDDVVAVDVEGG